jgi:sulfate/thiosulfate-binding protein
MKRYFLCTSACLWLLSGCSSSSSTTEQPPQTVEILNCSYDPTRELYREVNAAFEKQYLADHGVKVEVRQSHGGSSSQARAVVDGLKADVVTLALWSDIDQIRKQGLVAEGWEERLPNRSLPYYSTIVFVVRKGNPKGIKDWPDLVQPGVEIITPNPITGGGAKLNLLAAWGSVVLRGGSEAEAIEYLTKLYRQVPVLDSGARGSATTFAQKKIGDVHIAWENEAFREVSEMPDELEIVTPSISIFAEPNVTVVDAVAKPHGTFDVATDYLKFLYTDTGQEIVAKHRYRPSNETIAAKHATELAPVKLFRITEIAKSWDDAFQRFFAKGGVYETIAESTVGGSGVAK